MSNRYKADLVEMGVVLKEEGVKTKLILNRNPLSVDGYSTRLICGTGSTPKGAARSAIGEAAVTVGGIDMSKEGYDRVNDLSTVGHIEGQYRYMCILVLTPIEEEVRTEGGVTL